MLLVVCFYCYGDNRDLHVRTHSFPPRRSSDLKEETIVGMISGKVKGGFTVDIKDVRAFLPGSLVDVRPVREPTYLEGKELEFKIIKQIGRASCRERVCQ